MKNGFDFSWMAWTKPTAIFFSFIIFLLVILTVWEHRFPYKIKPYKQGKYTKIDHFQKMPNKIFKILEKNIGEHLMLELKKI